MDKKRKKEETEVGGGGSKSEREREKTLFYKDCSLGSVKNLTTSPC